MADMQSTAIYLIGGGASYTGAVLVGVPLPVALMAALGALIAVSNSERLTFSARDIIAALLTFCLALGLGLLGGYLVAWVVQQRYPGAPGVVVHAVAAVILAAYGQRQILPRLLGRAGREIDGGGQ